MISSIYSDIFGSFFTRLKSILTRADLVNGNPILSKILLKLEMDLSGLELGLSFGNYRRLEY